MDHQFHVGINICKSCSNIIWHMYPRAHVKSFRYILFLNEGYLSRLFFTILRGISQSEEKN